MDGFTVFAISDTCALRRSYILISVFQHTIMSRNVLFFKKIFLSVPISLNFNLKMYLFSKYTLIFLSIHCDTEYTCRIINFIEP